MHTNLVQGLGLQQQGEVTEQRVTAPALAISAEGYASGTPFRCAAGPSNHQGVWRRGPLQGGFPAGAGPERLLVVRLHIDSPLVSGILPFDLGLHRKHQPRACRHPRPCARLWVAGRPTLLALLAPQGGLQAGHHCCHCADGRCILGDGAARQGAFSVYTAAWHSRA